MHIHAYVYSINYRYNRSYAFAYMHQVRKQVKTLLSRGRSLGGWNTLVSVCA